MADNAQKTPLSESLNKFAYQKIADAVQVQGKALPCSVVKAQGAIITVKFEVQSDYTLPNVTVPLFGPEYIRYPIQPGDKGVVLSADAYLGGMSGLGGGVADLTQRSNLATLVFFPIGNKFWTGVDPNAVTIYGPNGVVLRDTGSKSTIILLPAGVAVTGQNYVNIYCGNTTFNMTSSGIVITGNVQINGNLGVTGTVHGGVGTADQIGLSTHTHTQPNDTHGDGELPTNAPTPGT